MKLYALVFQVLMDEPEVISRESPKVHDLTLVVDFVALIEAGNGGNSRWH